MLAERTELLNNAGEVLVSKYGGRFSNLINACDGRLFDGGLVDRLTSEFECFEDRWEYNGSVVRFNKRAQLGPAMLYARFAEKTKLFSDIDRMTVFADYNLPRALFELGVMSYSDVLEQKIRSKEVILPGGEEEIEIRAATVVASQMLIESINSGKSSKINALHMDYMLFLVGKNLKGDEFIPYHLTPSTAY